jgi:hypothetical protein
MEETANNTVGRLDVPPFTPTGTIDSFFDIFVEVDLGGNKFTTVKPLRVRGDLTHKPANPCDVDRRTATDDRQTASRRIQHQAV